MPEHRSLKAKLIEEMKEVFVISLYLALVFGTVATYRLLLPDPPASAAASYGFALIKALVFAKVIVLARMLPFARVFDARPLVVPTLYKVALYGAFAFCIEALEHLATGLLHGRPAGEVFREAVSGHVRLILARTLVVLAAFLPFVAITELSRVFGGARLRGIFLGSRVPEEAATP